MTLPPFDFFFRPVLQVMGDGKVRKTSEICESVKGIVRLDDEDYNETVPSGGNRYKDRISWSITYLKKGGLLSSPKYGYQQITDAGIKELMSGQSDIRLKYLVDKYPSLCEFYSGTTEKKIEEVVDIEDYGESMTPVESIGRAITELNSSLADELLNEIYKERDWKYFEVLVLKVMQSLGYGIDNSSLNLTGKPGDEGVDGEINEDRLGFDKIYVQAKHYRPDRAINDQVVRNFVGSMSVKGVSKGVLITTSSFTENARRMADESKNIRVRLIDGKELVRLMIDNNIGVTVDTTYVVKKLDMDFFEGI